MLDLQRLGVELRVAHRDQLVAFGEFRLFLGDDALALDQQCVLLDEHPPQRAGVARKRGAVRRQARHIA
jgi:hypothetical protein